MPFIGRGEGVEYCVGFVGGCSMYSSSTLWAVRDPERGAQERPEGADKKIMFNK